MSAGTATVLVVPAYNEAARFSADPWARWLEHDATTHLLFVDDGSTDNTPALLDGLRQRFPARVTVVRQNRNAGKAEAVRTGMLAAFALAPLYAGFIDADLSAPLAEVDTLRRELNEFPDLWAALGSRVKLLGRHVERYALRHYLGRVFATGASLALSLPVYDSQCGLKLFRNTTEVQQLFAAPFRSRWLFDVELLDRLATTVGPAFNDRVHEVPLRFWADPGGSKLKFADFVSVPFQLAMIRLRRTR